MAIVVPSAYALSLAEDQLGTLPRILWRNRAIASDYSASAAAAGYPASNLANTSTIEGWRGTSADPHSITIVLQGGEPIDGVGIERHNLGSDAMGVSLWGLAPEGDPEDEEDWSEIIAENIPAGDATLIYGFAAAVYSALRVDIVPTSVAPRIAVLYVGKMLVMERGVQAHTPIGWGIKRDVQTGRSQSGDFLGRVITGSTRQTTAQFIKLSPAWVRTSGWLDFASAAATEPFFFVWNLEEYPAEVGFVWSLNDLVAETSDLVGYADVTIEMEGVVL